MTSSHRDYDSQMPFDEHNPLILVEEPSQPNVTIHFSQPKFPTPNFFILEGSTLIRSIIIGLGLEFSKYAGIY